MSTNSSGAAPTAMPTPEQIMAMAQTLTQTHYQTAHKDTAALKTGVAVSGEYAAMKVLLSGFKESMKHLNEKAIQDDFSGLRSLYDLKVLRQPHLLLEYLIVSGFFQM